MASEFDLSRSMILARDTRGKGLLAQVRDIASLMWSRRRITAEEYYRYQLYDDRRYDAEARGRFVGDACHLPLIRHTCDIRLWAIADDKIVAHTLLQALGAPVPQIYALIHPLRIVPQAPTLRNAEEVAGFLRDGATYPFFAKPVSGVRSEGIHLVRDFDSAADTVEFQDGTTEPVVEFAERLWKTEGQSKGDGVLLQEVLVPHPELARLTGPAISGFRVLVVINDEGPKVIGAMWKVIGGDAIADNTWRPDALLAAIDLDSGKVTRAVQAQGTPGEEVTHHPVTGEALVGAQIPHWSDVISLCETYAPMATKVRFQGWDIAICEGGPVVIEVNTGSSFQLTQLATGEGIATPEFDQFVKWASSVNETSPRGVEALTSRL
ncbi:MAG: sugar-transfer associated ATP-grasp domain-containing protein [Myxococcota bacterium]